MNHGLVGLGVIVLVFIISLVMVVVAGVPLTAEYENNQQDSDVVSHTLVTGVTVYKGALSVFVTASGLVQPLTDAAGTTFAGVARASSLIANKTLIGAAPAGARLQFEKKGCYWYNLPTGETVAQTDVGLVAKGNSDNQVTIVAGDDANQISVGLIVDIDSVTNRRKIKIDNYC